MGVRHASGHGRLRAKRQASKRQTALTYYGYTESIRITFPAIVTFIIAKALAEGKIPIVTGTFSVIYKQGKKRKKFAMK